MSSSDYNYDEQGQFFPFFILTITGLITLPLTYSLLAPSTELESTAPKIKSNFKPKDANLVEGQKKKQRRRERRLKRFLTVLAGYLVMGWMIYLIMVTARTIPKIWDPYAILGIGKSASEREIKSKYRKLSLVYHPDKVQLDASANQTIEQATEHYVEISKAYKALTDEEVRHNYMQYGHPDGKQSFSIGIALPKFIITNGNGKYVLLVYGALLGVLLPYVVGKWWYGTQRMTKEGVLIASAGKLFREYSDEMTEGEVISALSIGDEYNSVLSGAKSEEGLGKIELAILADGAATTSVAGLSLKDRAKLAQLEGTRRKTLALLWAYLGRVSLGDSSLDDEKFEVAPIALALNEALTAICLAFSSLDPVLSTLKVSQHLIQAVPPGASPLLQLPHVTPAIARLIEGKDAERHWSIQKLMDLPEYQRRKLATDQPHSLTPEQYNEAVSVARQIPFLRVEKVFFKVIGERHITPGSLVQFVAKTRFIPPGTANVPDIKPADLEDIDPDEADLDGLLGRKPPKNARAKRADGTIESAEAEYQAPLAFAPYFARNHVPRWNMFLFESKQNRIVVPPSAMTTFDRPILDEAGKPTFHVQTLKLSFLAPPAAGHYSYAMYLICDSYIGMDCKMDAPLVVEDSQQAMELKEEDEISEPDEGKSKAPAYIFLWLTGSDSLAGQMQALKGGMPAPTPRKKKPVVESSDEESGTDEDEDDDSETDTDTEDES